MFVRFGKMALAFLVLLSVLATGAWQSTNVVSVERQNTNTVETPLYPGLVWSSLGLSTQNIRVNISGDSISVSGERFEAQEQFLSSFPLPQDLVNYYSNAELAKSGWVSYDAFDGPDGVHYIFYHESGLYLSVEFLKCLGSPEKTCVAIWKSVPVNPHAAASVTTDAPQNLNSAVTSSFSKISPANGANGVNASSVTLRWETYSSAQKYTYCVEEGDCVVGSTDWTSTYSTSVTKTLSSNKTYHWQIRALTCGTCTPKTWVYANNGNNWSFQTQTSRVVILGNAGVAGAVLSYVDGTAKTVTAGSTGSYSITVPYNWSGTVTPSKSGYLFTPASASFSNLTASQTIQNFTAGVARTVSGSIGVSNVSLSYVNGTAQTVVSDHSGNYSITIPSGWSGTVIPSHACYTFSPSNRSYSNINSNQTGQNYTASNPASGCAEFNVTIGGSNQGKYGLLAGTSLRDVYTGVNGGPVVVKSSNGAKVITSMLGLRRSNITVNQWTGIAQVMGVPVGQLSDQYMFPRYTNIDATKYEVIPIANYETFDTNVTVKVGATSYGPFAVAHGTSYIFNQAIEGGPVLVSSDNGARIVASLYQLKRAGTTGRWNGQSEMMGIPPTRLSDTSVLPYYDYTTPGLLPSLNIANTDTIATDITVSIGTSFSITYPGVAAGTSQAVSYPGVAGGPVVVTSSNGAKVIASLLGLRRSDITVNQWTGIAQVMGVPVGQLSDQYMFPRYTNQDATKYEVISIANFETFDTHVTVKVGATSYGPYAVAHGTSYTFNQAVTGGPVLVSSDNGARIVASLYQLKRAGTTGRWNGQSEMMGIPPTRLSDTSVLPYYDYTTPGLLPSLNISTP